MQRLTLKEETSSSTYARQPRWMFLSSLNATSSKTSTVMPNPELKEYRTEPYTHALASVINEYKPEISQLQQLIAMISKDVWFGSQKPDGSAEAKQYYKNFEKWFQYMNESNNKSVETA